ncbi:hypothetical protein [Photobacterium nomapromontoriensis]|uniref:hypothetical protein n=1 Tax=Photobacterium nomapromontoriensis TaxID=2910237 RepID=UPI003D0977B8
MTTPNTLKWAMGNNHSMLSIGVMAANWQQLATTFQPFEPQTEWLHIDIMDGNFVPKLTVGAWACPLLPPEFICDIHLMVNHAQYHALQCADAGAHIITLQYEACNDLDSTLSILGSRHCVYQNQKKNIIRGISVCPDTNLDLLVPLLPSVEMIQLLTLDPRTGTKMTDNAFITRLDQLNKLLKRNLMSKIINVDGSMSIELAQACINHGAHVVVSGSAIFANNNASENIKKWRAILSSTTTT